MRRRSFLAVAVLALALPRRAAAILVEDPTSYGYYAEQITQMAKQLEESVKQVTTMGGVLTTVQDQYKAITGTYNRAMGIINRVTRLATAMSNMPKNGGFLKKLQWIQRMGGAVGGVMRDTAREIDRNGKTRDGVYKSTKLILDEVFGDAKGDKAIDRRTKRQLGEELTQDTLKEAVATNEAVLADMDDRLATIKELADQIDATVNMKDAQDLTNRILVEVLYTLQDLLTISATANKAATLIHYRGIRDSDTEKRERQREAPAADKVPASGGLVEMTQGAGRFPAFPGMQK